MLRLCDICTLILHFSFDVKTEVVWENDFCAVITISTFLVFTAFYLNFRNGMKRRHFNISPSQAAKRTKI